MKGQALAIIHALESGNDRASAISAATGIPLPAVYARLAELRRLGAVRSYRHGFGRSSRPWERRAEQEKRHALRTGTWKCARNEESP